MDSDLSLGSRLLRAIRTVFVLALLIGLGGAAVYALSQVNARTYVLEVQNGRLLVLKGKLMPMGAAPWAPSDPRLVDAYAPVDLEGNASLTVHGQKFEDRDELDRALFQVLEMLAKPKLQSNLPADLEKGLALVRRAEKLGGLTDDQRTSLRKMQTEVAFFLARTRLDDARRQLEEALVQLKLAAESDSKAKDQASLMLLAVEPQVKLLATTLRATNLTADGASSLGKVLEPQLQKLFEDLGKAVDPATSPTAPPLPAPQAP